ncbi:hypothetical protein NQ318_016668 [Aromia moschata]|uniref:Carboxylic ester hydrolase n=1 Tax=Aromia moschata TaxID=1265417 RepID=A0AAV8Y1D8_9CUCU|nr:hypothetical protein NQ318_016668 [Aromia moschata]
MECEFFQNSTLQVTLAQGIVQGTMKSTVNQKVHYFSFEGIPYALPPVGNLRFKRPQKPPRTILFSELKPGLGEDMVLQVPNSRENLGDGPGDQASESPDSSGDFSLRHSFQPPVPGERWQGVLNSTVMDVSCVQVTPSVFNGYAESEDCLYINVFTPIKKLENAKNAQLLPVMVWIYGGAFLLGTANATYFGPDNLLEENVLVVHFGYRLASFGFLSTGDMESPGNYGLKDQHLALRWVRDNIRHFGGDPEKVTIFGESAGGVSVQHQLMYLGNRGLFRGAISESGSVLCTWAYQRQPRKIAFDLGRAAGLVTNSTKRLVDYLRSISTQKLKAATMAASLKNSLGIINGIPFAPATEPQHEGAFITEKNHKALAEGKIVKVPYIIGFNSEEAAIAKTGAEMAKIPA